MPVEIEQNPNITPYKEWPKPHEKYEGDIYVIGMGAVTPLGVDLPTSWNNLKNGIAGMVNYQLPEFGTEINVFGKVKAEKKDLEEKIKQHGVTDSELIQDFRREIIHRSVQMEMVALAEAMSQAHVIGENGELNPDVDPFRIGFYDGSVLAGSSDIGADQEEVLRRGRADSRSIRKIDPQTLASVPSRLWHTHGPALNLTTACSAGTEAIALGADHIREGKVDIAIVSGSDAFIMRPIMTKYFEALQTALSKEQNPQQALRAYDQNPTGTVIAEGAGSLILTTADMANKLRGKKFAKVAGWGSSADGGHPTNPNGIGTRTSLELALKMSGELRGPGYMNGHGGGTPGDAIELKEIYETFFRFQIQKMVAINSTKPSMGHMWGGAGAFESIIAIMAINEGTIPPMINSKDPLVDYIEFARNQAKAQELEWAGSTNTGLGGETATVIYKKAS